MLPVVIATVMIYPTPVNLPAVLPRTVMKKFLETFAALLEIGFVMAPAKEKGK